MANRQYFSSLAYYFQRALSQDVTMYVDMIDQLYEICDEDKVVLEDLDSRSNKNLEIIKTKYDIDNEPNPTWLGMSISNVLYSVYKEKYTDGEALALGLVGTAFISYKKNWLNKDEYYEIRDMFVPFNLPISIEMVDVDKLLEEFKNNNSKNESGLYTMVLLKKVGKCVIDKTVSIDDIKDAIDELNFDEAW
ncbi:MAG: hypothetical protein MJZ11_00770 [Lachnospiraceae bacterium]|nr:hypothetical protein [Lachnospiraceae bacterium]